MKKYLPFAFTLLLALAAVSLGQTATPSPSPAPKPKPAMSKAQIQKSLIATERKLWEAWKNKDPKPFRATLAADSVMVGEQGVADKETVIKTITSMDCDIKSYKLSDFKVALANPTVALISYKGTVDGTCGGAPVPAVWASSVYVNRGGKWYAFSHQESNTK
jgi:Domain of unknown function (DUF4440)